jgi:hypothetical protein
VTTDAGRDESMPAWHPRTNQIVFASGARGVEIIDDVGPWLQRLDESYSPLTYERAAGVAPR